MQSVVSGSKGIIKATKKETKKAFHFGLLLAIENNKITAKSILPVNY